MLVEVIDSNATAPGRKFQLKGHINLVLFGILIILLIAVPSSFGNYNPAPATAGLVAPAPAASSSAPAQAGLNNILKPGDKDQTACRHLVLGYYVVDYPGDTSASRTLQNFGSLIDSVASFSFRVDDHGNLVSATPPDGTQPASIRNFDTLVLIHNYVNGGFEAAVAHNLLASKANRQHLIQNTFRVLQQYGYRGVNVDLENIPPADRQYYNALIREFKETLAPAGYLTTVSIPAKSGDNPYNPWCGAFDYVTIGQYADWVQIMTYDEHSLGTAPGPVASLPWVTQVIQYAVTRIPPEKILLGIAVYGYDWSPAGAKMMPASSIATLAGIYDARPRWNSTYGVPYLYYYKGGIRHEVWYENAYSTRLKLDLVAKYGLMGIGIWRLGYEEKTFWQVVAEKLR